MSADHPNVRQSWWRSFLWPTWETRKCALHGEAWFFVITSYVLIGFAYLWPVDFRNASSGFVLAAWMAFMVRTFTFHLGLVYLVIAVVAGWKRLIRLLLATLPLVLVTLGPAARDAWPKQPPLAEDHALKVMSVNLLMRNTDTAPLIEEIQSNDPDVLLLQEYTSRWHAALQAALAHTYRHVRFVTRGDSFGTAIYSRHAFSERVNLHLRLGSEAVPQIRAVVAVDGQAVAFYNIHLLPTSSVEYVAETRRQFADLIDLLQNETLPAIVAGDFNFTENSAQHDRLAEIGFTEAHKLAGQGRGTTWPVYKWGRYLPGLRLDHIYLSRQLTATRCEAGIGKGSDHRPVIAEIRLSRERPVDSAPYSVLNPSVAGR